MLHPAFEEIACNICGQQKTKIIYPSTLPQDLSLAVTERFAPADHAKGNDQIVQCLNCGLAYANPRMKADYIWQGYSDAVDTKYVTQAEERMRTFKRTIRIIEQYQPQKGKLLDIGCAAGFFLKVAKDAGWNVQGVEPNKGLATFGAARYDVLSKNFLSSELEASAYDVVTFWDVLEHVPDPSAYIRESHRILKPGGFLFLNFPDFGSRLAQWSGQKWWFLSPVHIYYFNRQTISALLQKEKFAVQKINMHWQTLSLGYLFGKFADYNRFISKTGVALSKMLGMYRLPVRYYASQAMAIAQKPHTSYDKTH